MLHVTYSERSEKLLEALIERIGQERARPGAGVLDPVQLLVPNRSVETFLKLGIARIEGIAANLHLDTPARFFGALAEASSHQLRLIDRTRLEGLILSAFLDEEVLADPELLPAVEYLTAAGSEDDAVELRRVQLARQLAGLFEAYLSSRRELLDAWLERTVIEDPLYGETERWQRRLFQRVLGAGGLAEQKARARGERWVVLPRLFDALPLQSAKLPSSIHLFGFSHLALELYPLIEKLAKRCAVSIYALNPTRVFWEDATAPVGEPLAFWGRGGRELIKSLNALVPQADERFAELESPSTLLEQVQHDIFTGELEPSPDPERWKDDRSLRVLACPGVRREVEVVAEEIWRLVMESADGSEKLRFHEIAVLINARGDSGYAAHVGAVFRESHDLPFNMIDLPLAAESRIVEAIELLLALPLGRFRRHELLGLVTHPGVMARYPEIEPEEWLRWCDALAILHGGDRTDHTGTYIEKDLYNWDQGMRRLALGVFMGSPREGRTPLYEVGTERYLPEEVPGQRASSAAHLSLLVRSLIADARFARSTRLTLEQWVQFLELVITTYLAASNDQDERTLRRCLKAITDLRRLELGDRPLSYRLVHELVKGVLAPLTGGRGQHQADGVVVASYLPMRAVPYKVIFVLGLGAGRFPSGDGRSHLDLRNAARKTSDLTPEERDRWLFLETILSARERLYLSYESRDALTGEAIEPSVVIQELLEVLERGYLGEKGARTVVEEHRLRRFDAQYFEPEPRDPDYRLPGARKEQQAELLGREIERVIGRRPLPEDLDVLHPEAARLVLPSLGLFTLPAPRAEERTQRGPRVVRIAEIRSFLECPLQGSAKVLLRLREDEDQDVLGREDEVFGTSRLDRAVYLRKAFWSAIARGRALLDDPPALERFLAELYDEQADRLERKGVHPTGVFRRVERASDLAILSSWRKTVVEQLKSAGATTVMPLVYGRAEESAEVDEVLPPLVLEVPVRRPGGVIESQVVHVVGRTEALIGEGAISLFLALRDADQGGSEKKRKARESKEFLRGFVTYLMLAATGRAPPKKHRAAVVLTGENASSVPLKWFGPIERDVAAAYLRDVISEMLSEVHGYLFPFEAVYELVDAELNASVAAIVGRMQDDMEGGFTAVSSSFGPVPNPWRYPAPDEHRAREIVHRRYGLYFGSWSLGGEGR